MYLSDSINAFFDFGAAVALWRNVAQLRRDKRVQGVCISSTVFFTLWGYWNVWFYPSNGFPLSCIAGVFVVAANTAWIGLVIRYAPIGTRSVLYGVHAFWLHPFFIAAAWWRLYGFPWDPRLWVAFFVHDLGYWGKPNMDGPEGETHPEFGAALMRDWFGDEWGDLCLFHSRYYAKRLGKDVSRLCHADKLVFAIEPAWLYLPRVRASGELAEFISKAQTCPDADRHTAEELADFASGEGWRWHRSVKAYMLRWIDQHKDGSTDTWTRARHQAV